MPPMLFFLHMPRTGGTTLNTVLKANFAPEEILSIYHKEDYERCRELEPAQLDGIRLVIGHLMPQSVEPPRFYDREVRIFTLLREPVARIISEYRFQKSWPANHLYARLNAGQVSFREYLTSREKGLRYRGRNFMTHTLAHCFREDMPGDELLDMARHNLEHLFFFGVQDHFDAGLLMLADRIGLKEIFYEKQNMLNPAGFAPVSEEDRELAAQCNALDSALYAWALRRFEERMAAAGPALAARLKTFQAVNARFHKVCRLIDRKLEREEGGAIINPKR